MKIAFNTTELIVEVTNNDAPVNGGWLIAPDWAVNWSRLPFATEHLYYGQQMPVWWMSDKFSGSDYNVGNGTFSNIIITNSNLPLSNYVPTLYEIGTHL